VEHHNKPLNATRLDRGTEETKEMQTVSSSPWLTHARSNSTVRFEENRNGGGGVGEDIWPAETRVWKLGGNKRRTVRKNGFLVQQPNKRRHSKLSHTVRSTSTSPSLPPQWATQGFFKIPCEGGEILAFDSGFGETTTTLTKRHDSTVKLSLLQSFSLIQIFLPRQRS